ncbi:hypothetical protein BKA70DRAFT_1241530 [Coprinopsis sp. MPI-PUGE-AT-0042]|nr:hypothetical protein BKA70DRAFT_1241530 [Coprinopsis sp. MPI-PUGE-AT-0042]
MLEPGTPGRGKAECPECIRISNGKRNEQDLGLSNASQHAVPFLVLGGGEGRRESRRDEHSSGPERATPRETGDRRSGQTGKRRRQARGLRVLESGAIDRNRSGTEGTKGSLRIRKRNGRMSGPKSIPKVSWMAEGFGSGPEARECSGTRDMGGKRAEASRSSVARRQRQGDGIEQRWDGWGSGEVQPASERELREAGACLSVRKPTLHFAGSACAGVRIELAQGLSNPCCIVTRPQSNFRREMRRPTTVAWIVFRLLVSSDFTGCVVAHEGLVALEVEADDEKAAGAFDLGYLADDLDGWLFDNSEDACVTSFATRSLLSKCQFRSKKAKAIPR